MIDQISLILFSTVAFKNNLKGADLLNVTIIALRVSKFPSQTSDRCSWYVSINRLFYTKITEKDITLALNDNC